MSKDGKYLAIGAPGRNAGTYKSYAGEVHVYERSLTAGQPMFNPMLSIQNNNARFMGAAFQERLGQKVLFSSDNETSFLFVAANHGYDGASKPGETSPIDPFKYIAYPFQAIPNELWPQTEVSDTSFLRINIYRRIGSKWSRPANDGSFIKLISTQPFGATGIDMAVIGRTKDEVILAVRDYDKNSNSGDYSKPGGFVSLFKYNIITDRFIKLVDIRSNDPTISTANWMQEDWFGKGIALAKRTPSSATSDIIAFVGAPLKGEKAFAFVLPQAPRGVNELRLAQSLVNENYAANIRNSFFGGTITSSPDGKWVVVADSSGIRGRGKVHLYKKVESSYVVIQNLESAGFGEENRMADSFWYKVADIVKATQNVSNGDMSPTTDSESGYKTDWFGLSVAMSASYIVVSAPVDGCIYTYPVPITYDLPAPPKDGGLSPIANNPYAPPERIVDEPKSLAKGTLYGIIGGVIAVLIIVPSTWFVLRKKHRSEYTTKIICEINRTRALRTKIIGKTKGMDNTRSMLSTRQMPQRMTGIMQANGSTGSLNQYNTFVQKSTSLVKSVNLPSTGFNTSIIMAGSNGNMAMPGTFVAVSKSNFSQPGTQNFAFPGTQLSQVSVNVNSTHSAASVGGSLAESFNQFMIPGSKFDEFKPETIGSHITTRAPFSNMGTTQVPSISGATKVPFQSMGRPMQHYGSNTNLNTGAPGNLGSRSIIASGSQPNFQGDYEGTGANQYS